MFEVLQNIYEFLSPGSNAITAIAPLILAGVGALSGKMENEEKKRQEEADRKLAAATALWSPWTGIAPEPVKRAGSKMGDMLAGGASMFSFGQQFDKKKAPATGVPGQPRIEDYDANKIYAGDSPGPWWQPRSTYGY